MEAMVSYTQAAVERAMKVQEVILRALAKKITWWQAAEIIGISDRQMRRWRERYEEFGFRGLFDRRRGQPSPRRVPMAVIERVLALYRERYFDLNVCHFREKLSLHLVRHRGLRHGEFAARPRQRQRFAQVQRRRNARAHFSARTAIRRFKVPEAPDSFGPSLGGIALTLGATPRAK
jgi:transposase